MLLAGKIGSEESLPYNDSMAKQKQVARLIVAPSDTDPDMLYATRVFIGDPFIFLEQNGKRTLVLSDLEIDRAKRTAKADEFVMLSELEHEIQGNAKTAPPYEKVLAHFLNKRGVKHVMVPATFPLGYAKELERSGVSLETSNGLFWPERESKTAEEIKMLGRALRITEAGMKRAVEVLKASKPGSGKKLKWSGKSLTSEVLRAEIDSTILRAGGLPANFSARRKDRLLRRYDAHGGAWPCKRSAAQTLGDG